MRRLPPAEAAAFTRLGTVRTFAGRQALAHQGQVPNRVFVLRSGHVKVCAMTAEGKVVIVAVRGPDDLVGELSALDDQPRSASIGALDRVEAIVMAASRFQRSPGSIRAPASRS